MTQPRTSQRRSVTFALATMTTVVALAGCSSHPPVPPSTRAAQHVTPPSGPGPLDTLTFAPAPSCNHAQPGGRLVHDTGVINILSSSANGGSVVLVAKKTCWVFPGEGDDGDYLPTGPAKTYRVLPTAKVVLLKETIDGPRPRPDTVAALATLISAPQNPDSVGANGYWGWHNGSELTRITTDHAGNISSIEQLYHP